MVRKILRALTPDWEKKTTAIEEANDLSTLTLENLIGNLMAYEVQLEDRKKDEEPKNKKILAFNASSDNEESDEDDEDIAMITRKFKRFLKRGKLNSNKFKNTDLPLCYGCNKPGHIKKDCPLLKSKTKLKNSNFNNFNKIQKKKKKAMSVTWDDSDESSSNEEEEQEDEHQAHMCFMGVDSENQVSSNENEELLDAFNELFIKFKNLNSSYKLLKIENDKLNNDLVSPHASEIDNLKEINHELFSENRKLTNNNHFLKTECDSLKSRISDLDVNVNSLKSKYETISKNVGKFNKGKENLNNLLSCQKSSNNKQGLGFMFKSNLNSKIVSSSYSTNKVKQNHALLYSRFVKSTNSHNYANNDKKNDYMHVSYNKVVSKYSDHNQSSYIWIPKNSSLEDKNDYIANYKKNVCNSSNYLCYNKGKPNSYWV
jgi:FtsZ-binding cell division protein ZapB